MLHYHIRENISIRNFGINWLVPHYIEPYSNTYVPCLFLIDARQNLLALRKYFMETELRRGRL